MYADSHAHYYDEQFDADRYALLNSMPDNGISLILNVGGDIESSETVIQIAKKYDFMYAAAGIHPHEVHAAVPAAMDLLSLLLDCKKTVALGEIGLDYYYDNSPRDLQKLWFANQLELAKDKGLPFVVHDRDAHADTLDILKGTHVTDTVSGIIHCYSGSIEMARELLNMGLYLSFGGPVTFKNAVKAIEVVKYMPSDRLLIETDCPYLAPVPYRGKRNNSIYVKEVAKKIAEIKGVSPEEIAAVTMRNTQRILNLENID